MSRASHPPGAETRRRRYVLHLSSASDEAGTRRYISRIRLWTGRNKGQPGDGILIFDDEYELIEAVNRLLPRGSDVRDVMRHIDTPMGFFYLLRLTAEEAAALSWRADA
jgi:hypothetical protein